MAQELEDEKPLVPLQTSPLWLDVTGDAQTHTATLRSPQTQPVEIHGYINHYFNLQGDRNYMLITVKQFKSIIISNWSFCTLFISSMWSG
jgi:hypothetical protein